MKRYKIEIKRNNKNIILMCILINISYFMIFILILNIKIIFYFF